MPAPKKPKQSPRSEPGKLAARLPLELSLATSLEIQAAEGAPGGTFRIVAYTGGPMQLSWWDEPVVIDLASLKLDTQRLPILYDHCPDVDFVVGQTESLRLENGHLVAAGRVIDPAPVEGDSPRIASRVLQLARAGFVWQASVGGRAGRKEFVSEGTKVTVNGQEFSGPLYVARDAELHEISVLVNGADRFTEVMVARRLRAQAMQSFDEFVQALGFDPAKLTDQQRAALKKMYVDTYPDAGESEGTEETGTEEPAGGVAAEDGSTTEEEVAAEGEEEEEPVAARGSRGNLRAGKKRGVAEQMRQEAAGEMGRQRAIRTICANDPTREVTITEHGRRRAVPLQEHAIAAGWSAQRTELEYLRSGRPGPGIIVRGHDRDCTAEALSAALLLRAGRKLDNPHFQNSPSAIALRLPAWLRAGINDEGRNRIMEAAHHYAGMSAIDICREACRLDGRDAPSDRYDLIRAASSGSALTNIFTTNVNAVILATYLEAPDTTGGWVSETDVADFKTQERPRVNVGPGLAKLPRGGEANHANYADGVESYKIARYAKQFQIDEQDIIDDMLDALSAVPTQLARAAARLRPDLVYAILLDNGTLTATSLALFHADQDQGTNKGNLPTGAALSASALRTAVARMSLFKENAVNLNLAPTHLLVGPSNRHLAYELVNSAQILIAGTAGSVTERGVINSLAADGLTPVSEARLENGVVDPATGDTESGSATAWYLICNWAHTIEVGYLRGTGRAPQVRSFVLDKGKYGIGWDIKLDIGAKALDWKGMVKNAGA